MANYPLITGRTVQALAPMTRRITDVRQGRVEAPKAIGCSFQLTVEEARAAPNVVAGMYPFILCQIIFMYAYIYVYASYLLSKKNSCFSKCVSVLCIFIHP